MGRGLPVSIVLHLLALWAVAVWGGHVPRPPLEPQRVLRVQIARPPDVVEPQVSQPAPEPQDDPVIPLPDPEPEQVTELAPPEPEMPPKPVPQELAQEPEPEPEPDPEPETDPVPVVAPPDQAPPDTEDPPVEAAPTPQASGPAVSGTDVDFPFAWYLNTVEGTVARNWTPRQAGFAGRSERRCVVHFVIGASGRVSEVTVVRSSGVRLFDREAMRAVQSSRLPPLPAKFPHSALGVTFVFTLESGI